MTTKRLLISMEQERYEDLRRLAFEKKASMADLVRHAIEKVYEESLDGMRVQRGLEDHLKDPTNVVTLDEVLEEFGIELPGRPSPKRKEKLRKVAS